MTTPQELEKVQSFAKMGRGFGVADRFLYVRQAFK